MSRRKNKAISLRLSMLMGIYLIICFAVAALIVIAIIWAFDYIEKDFVTKNYIVFFLICFASATIVGWGVMLILTSRINKEANNLRKTLSGIANGDYSQKYEPIEKYYIFSESVDDFNKMIDALNSTAVLQKNFASNFSHEFKTPLISIRGFAKLLQNDDLTPEQRRTYTDTVVQQSERLAAMSTHVLELARYENTEIVSDKTLYSLDEQLRRCVRQQEREWLKKSLTVEGDLDPVDYYGNEELVEHIWSNLLSNAIRFTPAGGQITVVLRRGEGEVTVSVSDTGIGMDEETQRHIFDRFYRAAPYPDDRGNGLGLSIVRRVVTLCGGRVTVFSRPGNGSTFTVTLPAEE